MLITNMASKVGYIMHVLYTAYQSDFIFEYYRDYIHPIHPNCVIKCHLITQKFVSACVYPFLLY